MKRSSGSSPGDDGITYHHLKKMSSTHHFLATLFSKILLVNHTAPLDWCRAKIKLVPKGEKTSFPDSFRPIALTSVVGKLFNKIIASRLERFLTTNGIINTRGFPLSHQRHNGAHLCGVCNCPKCYSTRSSPLVDFSRPKECVWISVTQPYL